MIFGILQHEAQNKVDRARLAPLASTSPGREPKALWSSGGVGLGVADTGVPTLDDGAGVAHDADRAVAVSGNIFNSRELAESLSAPDLQSGDLSGLVLAAYEKYGERCFEKLIGNFAVAIWDGRANRLLLAVDHVGLEPLFYAWDGRTLVFASSLRALMRHPEVGREINFRALRNYLLFNYNPGLDALIKNVKKARPGHVQVFENGELHLRRYWDLRYENRNHRRVEDLSAELLDRTREAIRLRTPEDASDPGAFLSGGMDSSSVVGLMSELVDRPVHTFSFRCPEKFVDESYYARVMAEHYHTCHQEIPYTAEQLNHLLHMTAHMEEPLNDIGVELGSYIMGREAGHEVKYILTGDGGDELYAGHPVYKADDMAQTFERIPASLRAGIVKAAGWLPDSDKKKSLLVKARRFAYSYAFPPELLSNRWRIYYTPQEMRELCAPEVVQAAGALDAYDDIIGLYNGAPAPDHLSRCLYGDYQTLVRFHVDRLRLTRAFGVEARFPLHDPRLVEFSATIPADLKIRGSQVKYIQKVALDGVLPDEIVHRKDKMGHNVPMKNWIRESDIFWELFNDTLSEERVKARGWFKYDYVQTMARQHRRKIKDYSHRLYGLLVLELWLQNNYDG